MKKVAIITLNGLYNYGNRLQNYALQQSLLLQTVDVAVLQNRQFSSWIKNFVKKLLKKENGHIVLKQITDYQKDRADLLRTQAFDRFNQEHIRYLSPEDTNRFFPQHLESLFDFFIAGSDQVWNPLFWNQHNPDPEFHNYLLEFAPPEKRIAYAASFGIDTLPPEWEARMAPELAKFKAISVREEAGAKIVKKLIGRDVPVVLDPTMLLTADQWREIEPHTTKGGEKYVLTYFLGPQPESVHKEVRKKAEELGAQVIEMMDIKSSYYLLGPDGFVEMLDHAQAVFTDSFHGTVFSILFHNPFSVYQRHLPDGSDMGSRIDTLLAKTQLTARIQAGEFPTPEDFAKADLLLEKEREFSMGFLREALSSPSDGRSGIA